MKLHVSRITFHFKNSAGKYKTMKVTSIFIQKYENSKISIQNQEEKARNLYKVLVFNSSNVPDSRP